MLRGANGEMAGFAVAPIVGAGNCAGRLRTVEPVRTEPLFGLPTGEAVLLLRAIAAAEFP
jgi:hypothetical protein